MNATEELKRQGFIVITVGEDNEDNTVVSPNCQHCKSPYGKCEMSMRKAQLWNGLCAYHKRDK